MPIMSDHRHPSTDSWLAGVLRSLASVTSFAVFGVALAFLLTTAAHAQRTPRADFVSTHWGWGGVIKPDRCAPLRVVIRAGPKNFDGVLRLSYEADSSQRADLIATADATANQTREVNLVVPVPGRLNKAELELLDDRGVARSIRVTSNILGNPLEELGVLLTGSRGLAAEVGVASARTAFASIKEFSGGADQHTTAIDEDRLTDWRWQNLFAVEADAQSLPVNPAAYESLDLLIINPWRLPTSSSAAAATEAALQWVRAGGRLVVLINRDGSEWIRWLGSRSLVNAAPVSDLPSPAEVGSAFDAGLTKFVSGEIVRSIQHPMGDRTTWSDRSAPDRVDTVPVGAAALAARVKGRALSLTPLGESLGWTLRWTLPDERGAASTGLLAEGPFGSGWITVVGADPGALATEATGAALGIAWRDASRVILADYLKKPRSQRWGWVHGTDDAAEGSALASALDAATKVPPVSDAVFYGIAICVLALALLIGPFDAIFLRIRHARQRSWLTALGWITLVSGASTVLPPMLRSGPAQFGRYTVIDALVEPAAPGEATARDGWRSEVLGYWANGPARIQVQTLPGDSWRGFSTNSSEGSAAKLFDPLQMFAADPTRLAPEEFRMNQWTFRTFFVRGPAQTGSAPLDATLTREGDGYRIDLRGLPESARILRAGLHIGRDWRPTTFESSSVGRAGAPTRRDVTTGAEAFGLQPKESEPWAGSQVDRRAESLQAAGFALPGARQRSMAADYRVGTGRFAAIYLALEGGPPTIRLAGATDQQLDHDTTIIRLVVPFNDSGAPADPSPAEDPT